MEDHSPQVRKLLRKTDRRFEILIGWICMLASIATTAFFVLFAYLIFWRNPHQYGSKNFLDPKVIIFMIVLLGIAIAFSVFASRLLQPKNREQRLMSPFVLRAWGIIFSGTGILMLIDGILHQRWKQLPHLTEAAVLFVSMGFATFALARTSKDNDRTA